MPNNLIYFNNHLSGKGNRIPAFFFLSLIFLTQSAGVFSQEKTSIRKVVIDPGHGGKDPGAPGRKTQEKIITLAVALKLGNLIKANYSDAEVIYTRESDEFVELYQRAEIANKNKADLFISIHCNANKSKSYQGAETYVMGLHKSAQNLEISKLENAAILLEPDYLTRYDGFDPNSDESYITFTLFQNAYLRQSTEFAAEVQHALKDRVGMDDRGVRQAGFLVLYKTTMPAVLVEIGFISNPVEESYLISRIGQDHIADALYRAFSSYKHKLEKTTPPEIPVITDKKKPIPDSKPLQTTPQTENVTVKPVKEPVPSEKTKIPVSEEKAKDEIWFSIQVASSPTDIGVNNPRFNKLSDVKVYKHDGLYKYTTGREKDVSSVLHLQKKVKNIGFRDAFIVAFRNGERIPVEQARKLVGTP